MWIKKDDPDFNVTLGSYDRAEVCELVGLYILDILTKKFVHNKIGLYRDDGLGCFQILSDPEPEKVKKKLYKIFKQSGLSSTVECNLQITDFLDVTFDLRTDKYYPYRKDNNQLLYINKQSNHPPTIIKQIPSMVRKKISDISCTKECFNKAAPAYNNALKFSGFNENIQFMSTPPPPPPPPQRKNRNRKITNPPYSVNVKINIGKIFLRVIDKHLPRHHKYHKLFNRNNIKISYSCMANSVIRNHNTSLLKDPTPTDIKECSCHQKTECPLDKNCLSGCLVYNALVDRLDTNKTKHYY